MGEERKPQGKGGDSGSGDEGGSSLGAGLSMGLNLLVGVGLGCAVGYWIDKRMGSGPWGLVIGAAIGFAGGMYLLIKETMRL